MLKVNLEKKLLESNTDEMDALSAQAKEILGESAENDLKLLRDCGFAKIANRMHAVDEMQQVLDGLDHKRVVHISQIERILQKYNLRIRPVREYKYAIPSKIIAELRTVSEHAERRFKKEKGMVMSNLLHIVAPGNCFERPKPIDPILTYGLTPDYFYVVGKWGKDINIWRAIKTFFMPSQFLDYQNRHRDDIDRTKGNIRWVIQHLEHPSGIVDLRP